MKKQYPRQKLFAGSCDSGSSAGKEPCSQNPRRTDILRGLSFPVPNAEIQGLLPEHAVNVSKPDSSALESPHYRFKEPGTVFRSALGLKGGHGLRKRSFRVPKGVVQRNVGSIQREMPVEAAGVSQMAGGAHGIRSHQETVGIAVSGDGLQVQVVPGFLSLGSETLLGTAPEGNPADFPWSYCVFQNDMVSLLLLLFMIRLLLLLKTGGLLWHWQKVLV